STVTMAQKHFHPEEALAPRIDLTQQKAALGQLQTLHKELIALFGNGTHPASKHAMTTLFYPPPSSESIIKLSEKIEATLKQIKNTDQLNEEERKFLKDFALSFSVAFGRSLY